MKTKTHDCKNKYFRFCTISKSVSNNLNISDFDHVTLCTDGQMFLTSIEAHDV